MKLNQLKNSGLVALGTLLMVPGDPDDGVKDLAKSPFMGPKVPRDGTKIGPQVPIGGIDGSGCKHLIVKCYVGYDPIVGMVEQPSSGYRARGRKVGPTV